MADPMTQPTQQAAPPPAPASDVLTRDAYGQIRKVHPNEIQDALDAGATLLSPQEAAQHEAEKQYGGIGDAVAAGAINAADMVTLGFGKGLAADIGGAPVRQYIQGVEAAHPTASLVGAGLGVAVPMLVGDEADAAEAPTILGRLGDAIAAPSRALTDVGGLAERGVGAVTGTEAEGVLGRTLQRGIGMAASGGAEGAAIGTGQTYSDDAIQDHDLTAEQLLAGAAKGALLGAGFSGAAGAGGAIVRGGGEKALSLLGERAGGVDEIANNMALRATGAKTPEIRALQRAGIDPDEMGSWIVNELPNYTDKPLWKMSRSDITEAATKASDAIGEKIGSAVDELDAMAAERGIRPNIRDAIQTVQDNVVTPLRNMPGLEGHASRVQKYLDSFMEKAGVRSAADIQTSIEELARTDPKAALEEWQRANQSGELFNGTTGDISFGQFKQFRSGLDRIIRESGAQQEKIFGEALQKTRDVLEAEVNRQGADIAGADWLERYSSLKKQYKFAENLQQTGEHAETRIAGNRGLSLTDTIAGSALMGGYEAAEGENPMKGLAMGALGAVGNKLIREHGAQIGAYVLSRAAKLQAIQAVAARTDTALDSGISRFFGRAREKAQTATIQATVASRRDNFKAASARVEALANSPQAMADHVARTLPPHDVAPKLAGTMATKQSAALAWLAGQVPKMTGPSPLTPTVKSDPPSPARAAWLRKFDVYKDPVGTVSRELARGTLTRDHVDALKAMYPSLYGQVQKKSMDRLAELAAKDRLPSFSKRIQLAILLGVPADASFQPDFVQSQQMLYAQGDKAASMAAGNPPPAPQNQRGARTSLAAGEDELDAK